MTVTAIFCAVTQKTCSLALSALLAGTLAVLIDPIFRLSEYRLLGQFLPLSGITKFSGALTLAFLQVIALFYLILLLPRVLRTVAILLSAFVVVVQFSYWLTLSQFMTSTDLLLVLTVGADHRAEAVSSFFRPLVFLYALPYVLALSALIIAPSGPAFRKAFVHSLLPAFFLLASNYAFFICVPERSFHLNPLTSFLRSSFQYTFQTLREYRGPRDDLPPVPAAQRPLDSVIYIIDESVRGSHLSLNGYPRATTPFLQFLENQGLLTNFGICVAAGSFSYISNAYLITGHNAFPDDGFHTARNPTIFDYAKKMGYETIYIDINQGYLSTLVKSSPDGCVRSLDRQVTDQSFKECRVDLERTKDLGVARLLSSLLNERGGYFILVNKKGLHFHYRNRYPDNKASTIWTPVMQASDPIDAGKSGREKLVNTYDNGIRYQVDEFFRVLVSETTNQNYLVLYTSDHGQTLAEQGQVYTHMKPDKVIVDVPFFLVTGARYGHKALTVGISPRIRVSHLNHFATLLDLMNVPTSLRVRSYDKSIFSLTGEDNSVRFYMSGSLHGLGDYVVQAIPTPPDEGWGVSRPVGNGPESE